MNLRLDWCSHEAAKFAVERWHYTRSLPRGKLVKVGVWEDGRFIGCVVFGRGANRHIGSPYGLKQTEVCELVRVALDRHRTPVTRIVKIALKMLKGFSPDTRLVVSYADGGQGHWGGIYQGGNWIYVGSKHQSWFSIRSKLVHPKTIHSRYGKGAQKLSWIRENLDPNATRVSKGAKHKYLMPLDTEMAERVRPLAKPYPKCAGSIESDAVPIPGEEGRCESDLGASM